MQHRLPDILSCGTQWVVIFSAPAVSLKYGFRNTYLNCMIHICENLYCNRTKIAKTIVTLMCHNDELRWTMS